jgi:glycine/D-amino acid oxidase-like deaminating enzyme
MQGDLPKTADVCVVGAGIYGLVVGYHLARAGVRVVLIDRGRPGSEASSANAGSIGVQNKPITMQAQTLRSSEEWAQLSRELDYDVGYERVGGMRIATAEGDLGILRQQQPLQIDMGIPVEILVADDLRRSAPYLGPKVIAAAFCELDGLSNPLATNHAYQLAAVRHGARLVRGTGIVAIERRRDGFVVETERGPLHAGQLLNAAGAWSSTIAAMLGLRIPTTWALNMVTITDPQPALIPHVVTHVRGNLTVKQHHGRALIGGAWRGEGDPYSGEKRVHLQNLRDNLAWACVAVPKLSSFRVLRSWAGIQAHSPDKTFVMGQHHSLPGAWVFTAGSGGYTLAPYMGRRMAEWMLSGVRPDDVASMDIARFEGAQSQRSTTISPVPRDLEAATVEER